MSPAKGSNVLIVLIVLRVLGSLAALAAIAPALRGEEPVRLTDLRAGGESGVPNLEAAVVGDKLYFAATADGDELDLWVYDGLAPAAMVPGTAGIQPEDLVAWQGALYFEAGPFSDRELWRYDGINPPTEVLDLFAPGSGEPTHLTAFGPELCFSARTSDAVGIELVCWDGATAPDVYELRADGAGGAPESMTAIGTTLYFDAFADGVGSEPFAYEHFFPPELVGDLVPGTGSSNPESFSELGGALYFRASGAGGQDRVWRDDGVLPPTQLGNFLDVEGGVTTWHGRVLAVGSLDEALAPLGGIPQLHVLRSGAFVRAPWSEGGVLGATGFLDHRNALYFRAGDSATASDLFRYCGGGNVERLMNQFADTSYVSSKPILFQGRLYFSAFQTATGHELWAVDPWTALFCGGFDDGNSTDWSLTVP